MMGGPLGPPNNDMTRRDDENATPNLPKAQQELYDRLQKRQREDEGQNQDEPAKVRLNENWYSSDEDEANKSKNEDGKITLPKELTDVLSSMNKKESRDPRKSRDPRAAASTSPGQSTSRDPRKKPQDATSTIPTEKEKDQRLLEMDLGSVFGDLELPAYKDSKEEEEEKDPLGLPFKPHAIGSIAKEIDASIYSHSPLEYILHSVSISIPDYTDVITKQHIPQSQVQQDPRLKRYGKTFSAASDGTGAYSPTQQTVDIRQKPVEYSYQNNSGGTNIPAAAKVSRRDPRRRD